MRSLTMVVSAELNEMKKLIVIIILSAAGFAHAGKPTVGSAYGITARNDAFNTPLGGPTTEQARAAVMQFIHQYFKDPNSVQDLRIATPFFNTRATTHKDWVIVFECNAKNGFGGYTGIHRHAIMWKDGAIDMAATANFQWWQDFRDGLAQYQ
jgi:hypothetical protein